MPKHNPHPQDTISEPPTQDEVDTLNQFFEDIRQDLQQHKKCHTCGDTLNENDEEVCEGCYIQALQEHYEDNIADMRREVEEWGW